jgi:hypothetical protein
MDKGTIEVKTSLLLQKIRLFSKACPSPLHPHISHAWLHLLWLHKLSQTYNDFTIKKLSKIRNNMYYLKSNLHMLKTGLSQPCFSIAYIPFRKMTNDAAVYECHNCYRFWLYQRCNILVRLISIKPGLRRILDRQ